MRKNLEENGKGKESERCLSVCWPMQGSPTMAHTYRDCPTLVL